jgi:aspartate racemase
MKTIGLFGGTAWSSTIEYYRIINTMVNNRLGGYHSAKLLLKSIDYHYIMTSYSKNPKEIPLLLKTELTELLRLKPDSLIICCNSLHKYYDIIKHDLNLKIPVFHSVELVKKHIKNVGFSKVLLIATKFTMEDGFFAKTLEQEGISVIIPDKIEREEIQQIHLQIMQGIISAYAKKYFQSLVAKYKNLEAVILGCSEFALVLNSNDLSIPIIDPIYLQSSSAVEHALEDMIIVQC